MYEDLITKIGCPIGICILIRFNYITRHYIRVLVYLGPLESRCWYYNQYYTLPHDDGVGEGQPYPTVEIAGPLVAQRHGIMYNNGFLQTSYQ